MNMTVMTMAARMTQRIPIVEHDAKFLQGGKGDELHVEKTLEKMHRGQLLGLQLGRLAERNFKKTTRGFGTMEAWQAPFRELSRRTAAEKPLARFTSALRRRVGVHFQIRENAPCFSGLFGAVIR